MVMKYIRSSFVQTSEHTLFKYQHTANSAHWQTSETYDVLVDIHPNIIFAALFSNFQISFYLSPTWIRMLSYRMSLQAVPLIYTGRGQHGWYGSNTSPGGLVYSMLFCKLYEHGRLVTTMDLSIFPLSFDSSLFFNVFCSYVLLDLCIQIPFPYFACYVAH